MDPITAVALVNGASALIATVMRAMERAREDGEITQAQFQAVKAAGKISDDQVDAIVAAAKKRLGKP